MSADVTDFAARVRAALADVPAASLEELLEDLDEHLAETLAEMGDDLGSPEAYALELRLAAGLPEPADPAGPSRPPRADRLLAWWRANDTVRELRAFLPELRPGWWVLRGYLAAGLVSYLADGNGDSDGTQFLVPFGPWLCVPVVLAAVVLSVRLGRWSQRRVAGPRSLRRALLLAGNLLVVAVLAAAVQHDGSPVYADTGVQAVLRDPGYLLDSDGSPILNIFPFAADGRPLDGVLLYDQDGRPIDNLFSSGAGSTRADSDAPPTPSNAFPRRSGPARVPAIPLPSFSPASPTVPASPVPSSDTPSVAPSAVPTG